MRLQNKNANLENALRPSLKLISDQPILLIAISATNLDQGSLSFGLFVKMSP